MKKYKLAITSVFLLIFGTFIGYGIAKYNQSRYVIPNNQVSDNVGYIYAYEQTNKVVRTDTRYLSNDSSKYSSTYQYMQYIYSYLNDASSNESLIPLLEEIENETNAERQFRATIAVIDKLVLIDPNSALIHVQSMETGRKIDLVKGLFDAWSTSDMISAIDKAKGLSGRLRDAATSSILKECMKMESCEYSSVYETLNYDNSLSLIYFNVTESVSAKRLADLWKVAISNQDVIDSNPIHLQMLARKWVSESGLPALNEIDRSLSNPQVKHDILDIALETHARSNPRESFEFALNLPLSNEVNSLFFSIFTSWIDVDPVEAFTTVSNVEPAGRRRDFQRSVLNFWTYDHPRSLLNYAEYLPKQLRNEAQRNALARIAESDPQSAIKLANQTLDVKQLERGLGLILRTWCSNDVTSALDWLLNHEEYATNVEFLKTVFRE